MSSNVKQSCLIAIVLAMCIAIGAQEQKPQVIVGLQKPPQLNLIVPLPPGLMAQKATTACTECHEARIVLQQRLSKAAWTKEVDKMMKWGAVVDANDRDPLIDYLSSNFGVDQPPYIPPRTSSSSQKLK